MVLVVSFHVLADSFVTCVRVIISVPPVFIQLISGFINSTHLKLFVCESALVCMSILPVIMELFFYITLLRQSGCLRVSTIGILAFMQIQETRPLLGTICTILISSVQNILQKSLEYDNAEANHYPTKDPFDIHTHWCVCGTEYRCRLVCLCGVQA